MNRILSSCAEEFELASKEMGFLPALLLATLIILITLVGLIAVLLVGAVVLAFMPLTLAVVLPVLYLSRPEQAKAKESKPAAPDPWLSE